MKTYTSPRALASALLFALCLQPAAARAQAQAQAETAKEQAEARKVFCEPSRAVALVGEQLSEAKAFDNPVKRIAVMTRAADMLWPHEQGRARAVFDEAFELASRHFRERGDEVRREQGRADSRVPGLLVQLPDQRFVVLRAVARRDAAWARELAARAAEETHAEAGKSEAANTPRRPVGEKLLSFAESLLETDRQTAYAVARSSFKDRATMYLPRFLYVAAEADRPAADALYREALAAYAERDIDSLLYLSAYPFALTSSIGPLGSQMGVRLPAGFAADPELQRQFVAAFLGLAERRLAALTQQPPPEEKIPFKTSEPEVIYTALKVLESLHAPRHPAALERIAALQGQAVTLLSPDKQRRAAAYSTPNLEGTDEGAGEDRFRKALEQAEKMPPNRRDQSVAQAILWQSASAPLEQVEAAAQKVEDAQARGQVLNWLYFSRAQAAVQAGELDAARKLAERVEALEERALLFLNIASEGLKRSDDRQRAEELLSAVVAAARKAPNTEAKARALLGVAHLYARFDYLRGLAVMGEAVSAVNGLNDPDLAAATLMRSIQGKHFSTFMGHPMPGFTVESSFRELGARDFEATLSAANALADKYLRATAVLAVAARCLEESAKPTKPGKPAPARRGGRQ